MGTRPSSDSDMTDTLDHAEAQSAPLVGFLTDSLGDPSYFGVNSWIQVFYLVAGAAAAIIAVLALRQSANLARASFFFTLLEYWKNIDDARSEFGTRYGEIDTAVRLENPLASDAEKARLIQEKCAKFLKSLRSRSKDETNANRENDRNVYLNLIKYFSFIESIGLYVRMQYIPFVPVYSLFKQAILASGDMFIDHVEDWQKEPGMPPGLYRNALYLIRKTQRRERVRKIIPKRFRKE